jgi:hypothetical protein
MLGELMAVVGMANETNRLAVGFQVPVDERFKAGKKEGKAKKAKGKSKAV